MELYIKDGNIASVGTLKFDRSVYLHTSNSFSLLSSEDTVKSGKNQIIEKDGVRYSVYYSLISAPIEYLTLNNYTKYDETTITSSGKRKRTNSKTISN